MTSARPKHTLCAWPGCQEEGTFPAPKNPQNLSERQYFCAKHIKEFNKKWNGMEGLTQEDLIALQSADGTWDRPTWKLGENPATMRSAGLDFETAEDLFNFFNNRTQAPEKDAVQTPKDTLPPDVQEACVILDLSPPLTEKALKNKYHSMAKIHHPDLHQGSADAEERLKKINVAHQILQDWLKM